MKYKRRNGDPKWTLIDLLSILRAHVFKNEWQHAVTFANKIYDVFKGMISSFSLIRISSLVNFILLENFVKLNQCKH